MAYPFESSIVLTNAACNLVFASTTSYITESSAGQIDIYANSVNVMTLTSSGMALTTGAFVDTIETTLTDDDTHLPTSGAVFTAIDASSYTHPNHTGEVTSVADGAQTLHATAITNRGTVGSIGDDDIFLFVDIDTMYKTTASQLATYMQNELSFGGVWTKSGTNLSPTTAGDDILLAVTTERIIWGDGDTYIYEVSDDVLQITAGSTSMQFNGGVVITDNHRPSTASSTTGVGNFGTDAYPYLSMKVSYITAGAQGANVLRGRHLGLYGGNAGWNATTEDAYGGYVWIIGGAGEGIGDGGGVFIEAGPANGTGADGQIYFGGSDQVSPNLQARGSEGNVVYYNTTTGLLTYGDGTGLTGAGGGEWTTDTNGITYTAGNVGIGVASNATYRLDIDGVVRLSATQPYIILNDTTASAKSPYLVANSDAFYINFDTASATGALLYLKDDGNVSIGATSPEARFYVNNTQNWSATTLALSVGSGNAFRIRGRNGATNTLMVGSLNNTNYLLQVVNDAGTVAGNFSINPHGGDVGIGTTSPEALFHVKAADGVTGQIKVEGGKSDVTAIDEINSELLFGSNDASVQDPNQIGGKISSVTEATNGANVGMAFYTYDQTYTTAGLTQKMQISNEGDVRFRTGQEGGAEGMYFQHYYVSGNYAGRIFMQEGSSGGLYGFSIINAGSDNPTFGGQAFTLTGNITYFLVHDNSATGTQTMNFVRSTGAVNMYHGGSLRLSTSASGIIVSGSYDGTGLVQAPYFYADAAVGGSWDNNSDGGFRVNATATGSAYNILRVSTDNGFKLQTLGGAPTTGTQRWYTGGSSYITFSGTTITATLSGTATNATNVYVYNAGSDTNSPIVMTLTSTAGYKAVYEDASVYINASTNVIYAADFIASSDRSLKHTIKPAENVLARIMMTKGLLSTYIRNIDETNTIELGYIAQDLLPIFPETVFYSNDIYNISYTKLGAIAMEGVALVKNEVDELKDRVVELEKEVDNLKHRKNGDSNN